MLSFSKGILNLLYNDIKTSLDLELSIGAKFGKTKLPLKTLRGLHIIQLSRFDCNLDREIAGLGADFSEERAYLKATYEYFERKAFLEKGKKFGYTSTNGIASHRFKYLARNSSIFELFERDSFFRHWYSKTPFLVEKIKHLKTLSTSLEELERIGYKTYFKSTYLGHYKTILCIIICKNTKGFVVGLSSGKGKNDYLKAYLEASINLFLGGDDESESDSIEKIQRDGIQNLKDHRNYWLYLKKVPEWVLQNPTNIIKSKRKKPKLQHHCLESNGAYVIGTRSDELIPLIVGKLDLNKLNYINTFGFKLSSLNDLIHPLP